MNNYPGKIETDLLGKIFQACYNGDLKTINLSIPKLDLNSDYYQENDSARRIFKHACLSGNLEIVEAFLHIPISHDKDNSTMYYAFEALLDSNNIKTHHVITYLMNEPKLHLNRLDGFYSILDWSIKAAAQRDDLPLFKLLLNLEYPENHNTWVLKGQRLFDNACSPKNNADVIRYIYTEPLLKDIADPLMGFSAACHYQCFKALEFFIFEYKIEKTKDIEIIIQQSNSKDAYRMFESRQLNNQLKIDLQLNQELPKKVKI